MSHFFSPGERALLRAFGKTERDVLIRYGKSLASKKRKEEKGKGAQEVMSVETRSRSGQRCLVRRKV